MSAQASILMLLGSALLIATQAAAQASAQGATRYALTDNGAVVVDRKTGLVWKRCQEGKYWDGSLCKGIGKELNWEDARRAGTGAWRLPTIDELKTLTGPLNSEGATIDQEFFPDTDPGTFWSSSPNDSDLAAAWILDFGKGIGFGHAKRTYKSRVRLVQAGQRQDFRIESSVGGNAASGQTRPRSRIRYSLTDNDAAVVDNKTGLVWKRCQEGKYWTGSSCEGMGKKLNWHEAVQSGTGIWRLPHVGELKSLVEKTSTASTKIDPYYFPGTEPDEFWSSSPSDSNPGAAWAVNFGKGYSYGNVVRYTPNYLRLVRSDR